MGMHVRLEGFHQANPRIPPLRGHWSNESKHELRILELRNQAGIDFVLFVGGDPLFLVEVKKETKRKLIVLRVPCFKTHICSPLAQGIVRNMGF